MHPAIPSRLFMLFLKFLGFVGFHCDRVQESGYRSQVTGYGLQVAAQWAKQVGIQVSG
jgi:hypothetical protein